MPKLNRGNRKGIIKVVDSIIDDYILPQVFKRLEFIPLKVVYDMSTDVFTMTGTSHYFDEVNKHGHVPEYDITITESSGGQLRQLEVRKRG